MRKENDRVFAVFSAQMVATWHLWPFRCIFLSRGCILVPALKNAEHKLGFLAKSEIRTENGAMKILATLNKIRISHFALIHRMRKLL